MATTPHSALPGHFASLEEVKAWLDSLKARDGLTVKCLLTMRWLVIEQMDKDPQRQPLTTSITDFIPDQANVQLPESSRI